MDTTRLKTASFRRKLIIPLLIAYLAIPGISVHSQESSSGSFGVYPTFGFGFGFFYPKDVNKTIDDIIDVGGYLIETGTQNIFMFYDLHAGLTFRIKRFDISALFEYDIAPKWIFASGGEDLSFYFSRLAPGVMANLYVPVGSGKHAFFLGGGVNYSIMNFKVKIGSEEYKPDGSTVGFKAMLGFSLQFGKFNLQPYLAFNYAKATTAEEFGNMDLDYTNGQLGLNFSFHRPINYK